MKTIQFLTVCTLSVFAGTTCISQNIAEKTHELSKNSSKGYFYDAIQNPENGNIEVTYKFKNKSKDVQAVYETYSFDKDLNLLKQEESALLKTDVVDKPDYSKDKIYATIGGCTSFDVLSTRLHLRKRSYNYTWNKEKKDYDSKRTEDVEIKPKNDDDRAYSGYDSFLNGITGNLLVLASSETKGEDKRIKKDFLLLNVKTDLSVNEIPLPLGPSQLVFSKIISNHTGSEADEELTKKDKYEEDIYLIFAPSFEKNSTKDYKKYTFLRVDAEGKIKENVKFDAPSINYIITGVQRAPDGSVYFCGSYTDKYKDKTFDQLYKEYSPMENPCYTGGANQRMQAYENKTEKMEMDYFSVIKFKNGKQEWTKNNSIEDMERVVKTAPNQKKTAGYNGKRLLIQYFNINENNGDLLIAGQLVGSAIIDKVYQKVYKDVVCLQLSSVGEIKAQYTVKTESISDKLNTVFEMPQNFFIGNDGQTLYWNLLETKSVKGYASFFDAYYGNQTLYANYYPSMMKINTATNTINEYDVFGNRKFLLNKKVPYIYNQKDNTITYIGSDKEKKLWLAKYKMN